MMQPPSAILQTIEQKKYKEKENEWLIGDLLTFFTIIPLKSLWFFSFSLSTWVLTIAFNKLIQFSSSKRKSWPTTTAARSEPWPSHVAKLSVY